MIWLRGGIKRFKGPRLSGAPIRWKLCFGDHRIEDRSLFDDTHMRIVVQGSWVAVRNVTYLKSKTFGHFLQPSMAIWKSRPSTLKHEQPEILHAPLLASGFSDLRGERYWTLRESPSAKMGTTPKTLTLLQKSYESLSKLSLYNHDFFAISTLRVSLLDSIIKSGRETLGAY